jgi:hypothetical protein
MKPFDDEQDSDEEENDSGEEEDKYRSINGTIDVDPVVCKSCIHCNTKNRKICWDCDRGSNFQSATKNLKQIHKRLMSINAGKDEALADGTSDPNRTILSIGFVEGLKWVMSPFGTEKELYEKFGFEWDPDSDEDE